MSTIFSMIVFTAVIIRQIRIINYFVIYNYVAICLSIALILIMLFGVQELADNINSTIYHILGMPVFYFIAIIMLSAIYLLDSIFDLFLEYACLDITRKSQL